MIHAHARAAHEARHTAGRRALGRCDHFVAVVGPRQRGREHRSARGARSWQRGMGYVRCRPATRAALAPMSREHPAAGRDQGPRTGIRLLGCLRLLRSITGSWLGYLVTVRPVVRRGGLVVADGWGFGRTSLFRIRHVSAVQGAWPRRQRVCRRNLTSWSICRRPARSSCPGKHELSTAEIATELAPWRGLPIQPLRNHSAVDAPTGMRHAYERT